MKTRGRGTFIKPALDYCSFKCALHLQPMLPETSVPVSFNRVVSSHCDFSGEFEKAFEESYEKGRCFSRF